MTMTLINSITSTPTPSVIKFSVAFLASAGGIWTLAKITEVTKNYLAKRRMLEKWSDSPQDLVIIHTLPRGKTAPSASAFVIKLETYLRMINIPYQMDFEYPFGPKGKTPWITLNGHHMGDSQLIIEYLSQKFNKSVKITYNEEQLSIARAVRIMIEEHFYWGLGLWRYVYSEGNGLSEIFDMPPRAIKAFYKRINSNYKIASWYQGIGRHRQQDVIEIMSKNLRTVSKIIGNKRFLLGDEPCEEDCAVFGFLAQVLWCAPGSPYTILIQEELINLKSYCFVMKEKFWPDWDDCLAGARKLDL